MSRQRPPSEPDLRATPLAATLPAPTFGLTGRTIGKYVLEDEIGSGGMGRVYRARHAFLGHPVAIKLCLGLSDEAYRDTLREGRAMARLHDPHVVRVLDVGVEDGLGPYLAMELLHGPSLDRILQDGALPPTRAADLALDLAYALRAAHAASLVHRDLKPSNVIVEPSARGEIAKVLDFGIVKPLSGSDQHTSVKGRIVGTPLYMSPEQWRSEPITTKSDIWSFGVLLFEMLTGTLPFEAPSPWELCVRVNEGVAPRLQSRLPAAASELPGLRGLDDLDALVARCLQRDPAARPDAADLVVALQTAKRGSHTAAPPPVPTARRSPRRYVLAAAVVLIGGFSALRASTVRMPDPGVQLARPAASTEPTPADPTRGSTPEPHEVLAPLSSPAPSADRAPVPAAVSPASPGSPPKSVPPRALPADRPKAEPPARPTPPAEDDILRTTHGPSAPAPTDDDPLRRH